MNKTPIRINTGMCLNPNVLYNHIYILIVIFSLLYKNLGKKWKDREKGGTK